MKILIFSDLHLHNWAYGSTLVNGVNSRLLAQAKVLDQIAEYTAAYTVDHIVFCGDLFHTHGKIDSAVLKVAYEGIDKILDAADCEMTFLVGNHDTDRKDKSVHCLHWLNAFGDRVTVVDDVWHDTGTGFSFLSYTEDQDVIKKFLRMSQPIAFMHQGMVDVPMASGFVINEIFNVDMIPDHVRHVFTGHYHPFILVSDKATVVGTPLQHTWADTGDTRGFLVVDTDTLVIRQVNTRAPRFRTLNMGSTGSLSHPLKNRFQGDYVRVTSFDESMIGSLRQELLDAGAASVEFVVKPKLPSSTVVKAISAEGMSMPELVKEYENKHNVSNERRDVGKELMK